MKKLFLFVFFILFGCSKFHYECVQIGMTKEELIKSCGPYESRFFDENIEHIHYRIPKILSFYVTVELEKGIVKKLTTSY